MTNPNRRNSRRIDVGGVAVGAGAPVSIQSMTNTPAGDVNATLAQIRRLADAGCQIVRLAVPDMRGAELLADITAASPVPLVADIHFDWRLALKAVANGIAAVRINPGNIGGAERVRAVAEAAGNAGIPIRVGVNSGSLPKGLYESFLADGLEPDDAMARALCEAALKETAELEICHFTQIAVSLKASSVPATVRAYRMFAERTDYPLHVGVTEAGTPKRGIIKSAAGIGALLLEGIGDTIRVSLTADPVEEVHAARILLEAVGLRSAEPELVSCPTCARTAYNLIDMASRVETLVAGLKSAGRLAPVKKIAVMGCSVNGPGEARDADYGLAGAGGGRVMVFHFGHPLATLPEEEAFALLRAQIEKIG